MTTAPSEAAAEHALELTEMGVAPDQVDAWVHGYMAGRQDAEKETGR